MERGDEEARSAEVQHQDDAQAPGQGRRPVRRGVREEGETAGAEVSRGEWLARQLLPPASALSIHDVVARAGWLHTAGGTGPYLSLLARIPGLKRQQVDEA